MQQPDRPRKKLTISELRRFLPIQPPPFDSALPPSAMDFIHSSRFSNLSLEQQKIIKDKLHVVYRNYFELSPTVEYLDNITSHRYTIRSLTLTLKQCSQRNTLINWYKFIRVVMQGFIAPPLQISSSTLDKLPQIYRQFCYKKSIREAIEQICKIKKGLDQRLIEQLSRQALFEVKQFIERNRKHCEQLLLQCEQIYPSKINFILLDKIVNKQLQMWVDRKKVIYLYFNFDLEVKGWFLLEDFVSKVMVVQRVKKVEKQSYYLKDLEEVFSLIRDDIKTVYYSSHDLENDFALFYQKKAEQHNIPVNYDEELDEGIFYEFINEKCSGKYSRYLINRIHKKILYKNYIHYLFNRPNITDLSKTVEKLKVKKKKKRILKKENPVFYSYRLIILNLISRCKQPKLSKQKLIEFCSDFDTNLSSKSFYCVWRVYPQIINVQRIRKDCKLSPLACYLKIRRTDQEYDKLYEDLIDLGDQEEIVEYWQVQDRINFVCENVIEVSKIKPLPLERKDKVKYRETIQSIFQEDFQIYVRSYIHRKVSEKAYALWKGYKAKKEAERRLQFARKVANISNIVSPTKTPEQRSSGRLRSYRSRASTKSIKTASQKAPAYNPESLQIVSWNLHKLLDELSLPEPKHIRQFHRDEHMRQYLCVNKKQTYEYRTLTTRYCLHPVPGVIGMGSQLLFLNNSKVQKIKIKFFYKPGIQVIDFNIIGNDIIVLTSYFTIEFYNLSQNSNYSQQSVQLVNTVSQVNFGILDNVCFDRVFSRFPIFLRVSEKYIIVNTSMMDDQIKVLNYQTKQIERKVQFTQRQHIFHKNTLEILQIVNGSSRKNLLVSQIFNIFNKEQIDSSSLLNVLNNEISEMEMQGKNYKKLTDPQIKNFIKNMSIYSIPLSLCILKQEFNMIKQEKIPSSLMQVLNSLMEHMMNHNISLISVFSAIDRQNQGFIKMKSLKDYLLKITHQVYLANQKEIDEYLRSLTGKNIEYENFCSIMKQWQFSIWQRPKLIIQDFIYVPDSNLIIYTIELDENVYIKNLKDNKIIGVLSGHSCAPSIYFIQESYMLVTGDSNHVRVWRIYEDFIRKYDQSPPWEIFPYSMIPKAHDGMITSILYLKRAHHLVTTSLDSTTKFWQIQPTKDNIDFQEVKRFYSDGCVYLNSKSNNITLDSQGCKLEVLALAKVSKQINQNNKYKYQMKLDVFHVENTWVKTGSSNIYLQLPPKLKTTLQAYVDSLSVKKKLLLSKTVNNFQQQTMKNNLISDNIERTFYEAVKNLYIFGESSLLSNISHYLGRKKIQSQILRVIYEKYGIVIVRPQKIQSKKQQSLNIAIQLEQKQNQQCIKISEEEIDCLKQKIKSVAHGTTIPIQQALNVAGSFLNIVNFEKLESILKQISNKNGKSQNFIDVSRLLTLFKPLKLNSQLQKFYAILRSLNLLMRNRGLRIWNIFTNNKVQLQKRRTISQQQFEKFFSDFKISKQKISLVTSLLSKQKYIHIDDLIYYTKLAWQQTGISMQMSQSPSNIFIHNSDLLSSKWQNFKLDSEIEAKIQEKVPIQLKIRSLQESVAQSSIRDTLGSRKSSRKMLKEMQSLSEAHSQQKSQRKKEETSKSRPLSSSNSRVSFSNDSQNKVEGYAEIKTIVKKIKEMMKNQGKNLWELVSATIPEFMENSLITETQYFNILASIKSPIYLKDKLKLMWYIMRQSAQFTGIDINVLFELFEPPPTHLHSNSKTVPYLNGEKYIIGYLISKLSQGSFVLQHSINQLIFKGREEVSIEDLLQCLENKPFSFLNFCLKQFQSLLHFQNKLAFTLEQFRVLLEQKIVKWNIKVEQKQTNFIEEIIHRMDNKGLKIDDLLPKPTNGVITYPVFRSMINTFFQQKEVILENQFIKIYLNVQEEQRREKQSQSQSRDNILKRSPQKKVQKPKQKKPLTHKQILSEAEVKYKDFVSYIQTKIQQVRKFTNSQKDGVRKMLKALQNKKISLLHFFCSLDRNRNYYLNQNQFLSGLAELKVSQNFWSSIHKKDNKRMCYYQLVNYLVENQLVNYKCVDSELQEAMLKFVRRFMRNDDIQAVFDRLRNKQSKEPFNITFKNFETALKMTSLFKDQEIFYIFGAFANAQHLKNSSFSNDTLIKDQANIHKTFNFKMFSDIISIYKNENITKTPHYRLCNFLKKRNISLLNQFTKWMQRNKKNKQISQAIKNKTFTLSKQLYANFIKELGTQLSEKEIKQILLSFPSELEFTSLNQKIQQMYKKGNSNIETQQINSYLKQIVKKYKKANVSMERLFKDFCDGEYKMSMNSFSELLQFLEVGLTKIQNRMIFQFVDLEKKGYITLNQLNNALEDAGESLEKQQDQYQLDYIIEKLLMNKTKFVLKPSKIAFNIDRCYSIFSSVLTRDQNAKIYKSAQQHLKSSDLTQGKMQQYLIEKQKQIKAKKDKKYKQLIINFLNFLKKANIDVSQAYTYFTKDTGTFPKNKFLICYQSLGLKASILQINTLYSYLDQGRTGAISKQKWQDKFNLIQYEKQNQNLVSGEQLQIFYKVKLILADIYLIFIHKLFKTKQIYAYFDLHGDGTMTHQQFLHSIQKLGLVLQESNCVKLVNYLDKQRLGIIDIANLVFELENCLNSKTKLILETKTSCIFKEKVHLIQQKQGYFIDKLVSFQHFIETNEKLQSCILMTDFLSLIKDFGIILGEDQFNDVERNFKFNKDNLQLYPLYYMFINIFKSFKNESTPAEIEHQRFQKLFKTLLSHNLTLKIFTELKNIEEASTFLTQLKIFTPIEIKLMVQSITLEGTQLIDVQKLVIKTRDSFLKQNDISSISSNFSMERQKVLKEWLKNVLSAQKIISTLSANSGRIDLEIFRQLLLKNQIVLKQTDIVQLFKIFAGDQDFVLIQDLLGQQTDKKDNQFIFQNQEKLSQFGSLVLDHIAKSLNFKGVSLEEAWQKYFSNFGFISIQSFYEFLEEIGFETKTYEKELDTFINEYLSSHQSGNQLKGTEFEKYMKKYGHCPKKLCNKQSYIVQSQVVNHLASSLLKFDHEEFEKKLEKYIRDQGWNPVRIRPGQFASALVSIAQIRRGSLPFLTNLLLKQQEAPLKLITYSIKKFLSQKKVSVNTIEQKIVQSNHYKIIQEIYCHNFIEIYKESLETFQKKVQQICVPNDNIERLGLSFVIQNVLQRKYLLFCEAVLQQQVNSNYSIGAPSNQLVSQVQKNQSIAAPHKFTMKLLPNLIVESCNRLNNSPLFVINNRYEALPISQRKQFQTFAEVNALLDPEMIFYHSKDHYLWERNNRILPKNATNYRWKYIPLVALNICKQLQKVKDYGYVLPHLRYNNLDPLKGINCVVFPAKISEVSDRTQNIPGEELFQLEDGYSAPEIWRKSWEIGQKVNSWIAGCIIYEFMWGHSPNSFIMQLLNFMTNRDTPYTLSQVLDMQFLPHTFSYKPFKIEKIVQLLQKEHGLTFQQWKIPSQIEGSRGLFKQLEILYGNQYMYYKKQFDVLLKLQEIVDLCLKVDPNQRLDISSVISMLQSLIPSTPLPPQYMDTLKGTLVDSTRTLLERIKNQQDQLKLMCSELLDIVREALGREKIDVDFIVPKYYPWPHGDQTADIYVKNVNENKQQIRRHGGFNVLCTILNAEILEVISKKTLENDKKHEIDRIFSIILVKLLQTFESYDVPTVGYVQQILQVSLQFCFGLEQPFSSSTQSQKGKNLRIPKVTQTNLLETIKNMIYLDGSGNPGYPVLKQWLDGHKKHRLLFEYFYSALDLLNKSKASLAINYFMCRTLEPEFWEIISYLRLDLLVFNILVEQSISDNSRNLGNSVSQFKQSKQVPNTSSLNNRSSPSKVSSFQSEAKAETLFERSLKFFIQICSFKQSLNFPLINSNIFYLKLGQLLTVPLGQIEIKIQIILIVNQLLRNGGETILKRITQPSFPLFSQIVKMMIEPAKGTARETDFEKMFDILNQFCHVVEEHQLGIKEIQRVHAGKGIFQRFKQIEYSKDEQFQ